MKVFGWVTLIALVLLAVFTIANWSLFTAPATLDFLVFSVQGPLGLVLLGVTLAFVVLFAIYALSLRTAALVEQRRHMRELQAQRELAETAEASRFTALRTDLEQQRAALRTLIEECRAQALARADALETSLVQSMNETANALFANIAHLDDKLDRVAARGGGTTA
jgi:uncharacterized integral membrane protein